MTQKPKGFMTYGVKIPTRVDVDALIDAIGIPQPGDHISYTRIAEVTKLNRNDGRWVSVVNAWIKHLRTRHNVELRAVPNEGYDVLSDNGKTDKISNHIRRAANQFRRAETIAGKIDRRNLTDENKTVYDHQMKFIAAVKLADLTIAKQQQYPELDKPATG